MKKISILLLSMIMISFFACKKDEVKEDQDSSKYQSKGYIPLKAGSYWIYQSYRPTASGEDTAFGNIDSVYISGTKEINSKTYYISVREGNAKFISYVRDSVGYLVDSLGNVIMSEVNFTDTIFSKTKYNSVTGKPLYHISKMMYDEDKQIIVPAGTFNHCIEARDWAKVYMGNPAQPNPFYNHYYYAKNVGLVEYTYRYTGTATVFKVKLIRYHIAE